MGRKYRYQGRFHSTIHNFLLFHAYTAFWKHRETKNGNRDWHFLIAWNGERRNCAAAVALCIHNRTAVTFHLYAQAAAWKETRCSGLTAELAIETAKSGLKAEEAMVNSREPQAELSSCSYLPTATTTVPCWVERNVSATYSTAKDRLVLVNGVVVSTHAGDDGCERDVSLGLWSKRETPTNGRAGSARGTPIYRTVQPLVRYQVSRTQVLCNQPLHKGPHMVILVALEHAPW